MWLRGFGTDEYRPDKLGLVIDVLITRESKNILILWETNAGSMESSQAQSALQKFLYAEKWTIIQMLSDGTSAVHFPPNMPEEDKKQHLLTWEEILKGQ